MRKEPIKLSRDLIWGIKKEAMQRGEKIDTFIRRMFEFWKDYKD